VLLYQPGSKTKKEVSSLHGLGRGHSSKALELVSPAGRSSPVSKNAAARRPTDPLRPFPRSITPPPVPTHTATPPSSGFLRCTCRGGQNLTPSFFFSFTNAAADKDERGFSTTFSSSWQASPTTFLFFLTPPSLDPSPSPHPHTHREPRQVKFLVGVCFDAGQLHGRSLASVLISQILKDNRE
jgi:hypothetical protein